MCSAVPEEQSCLDGQVAVHTKTRHQTDKRGLYQRIDDDDDELMLNVLRCHLTY